MGERRTVTDYLLYAWGALVFAFLFLPILVIIVYSFNEGRLLVSFTEFGFGSFRAIVDRPAVRSAASTVFTPFSARARAASLCIRPTCAWHWRRSMPAWKWKDHRGGGPSRSPASTVCPAMPRTRTIR